MFQDQSAMHNLYGNQFSSYIYTFIGISLYVLFFRSFNSDHNKLSAGQCSPHVYIVRMTRDSPSKNAEFSQLVSAMGWPQERRFFINIYQDIQLLKNPNIFLRRNNNKNICRKTFKNTFKKRNRPAILSTSKIRAP